MRIVSLVPSATELLFALGLGADVVGVTHECDYPPQAATKPHVTSTVIGEGLGPAEIDAAVREHVESGRALYELDAERVTQLRPDLIVAQQLCLVCAVSYDDVCAVAAELPGNARTVSLDPATLQEVLGDALTLGDAAGVPEAARALHTALGERLAAVESAVHGAERPRVVALEWLDPPFLGGHWVPEMIELAGGVDPLGEAGQRSRTADWEQIAAVEPDVVVAMQCGYGVDQAATEAAAYGGQIAALGADAVWAVDASASFSRPGPRLVDGTELLGHLLHPERVPAPAGVRGQRVVVGASGPDAHVAGPP
ncbi:MAG: cobalamin-binding protein [Solirubrobacterales bacterium]